MCTFQAAPMKHQELDNPRVKPGTLACSGTQDIFVTH